MGKRNKDLIINKNPKSLFAESIRSIRTNLAFASLDKEVKIIMNTSPEAGDGKSFVTANLAVAYAQENKNAGKHRIFQLQKISILLLEMLFGRIHYKQILPNQNLLLFFDISPCALTLKTTTKNQ